MLNDIKNEINTRINLEESHQLFIDTITDEAFVLEDFIEYMKGNNSTMNNDKKYYSEDTEVDLDIGFGTELATEEEYDDDYSVDVTPDLDDDDLTDLQNEVEYDDDFTANVINDFEPDTELDDEVLMNDTQTTPVDVNPYSSEDASIIDFGIFDEDSDIDVTADNFTLKKKKKGKTIKPAKKTKNKVVVGVDDLGGNYMVNEDLEYYTSIFSEEENAEAKITAMGNDAAEGLEAEEQEDSDFFVDECGDMDPKEQEDSDFFGEDSDFYFEDVDVDVAVDADDDDDEEYDDDDYEDDDDCDEDPEVDDDEKEEYSEDPDVDEDSDFFVI